MQERFAPTILQKKEWVLNGDTVYYSDWEMIKQTLDYDFSQESNVDYSTFSPEEAVKHFTRFITNLWQIHPFGEGTTRTTAVFTIKYLRSLGFEVNNEAFEKHSWYFRNALVRANYTNMQKGIYMNTEYLEKFFRNILLGEKNELKNRYTHIDYDEYMKTMAENEKASVQNLPVNLPVNKIQAELINLLKENPSCTYDDLAEKINRTRETVRVNLRKLEGLGIIKRVGADKNGHWEIVT